MTSAHATMNGFLPFSGPSPLFHYAEPSLPFSPLLNDDRILVLRLALLSTFARLPRSALELPECPTQLEVLAISGTREQDVCHEQDRAGNFRSRSTAEGSTR